MTDVGASLTAKAGPGVSPLPKTSGPASVDGDSPSNNELSDGPKQHLEPASNPSGSQDAASSNNQSQSGASSPAQGAPLPSQTVVSPSPGPIDHLHGTNNVPPSQTTLSGAPQVRDTVKAPDSAVHAAADTDQALPTINSARLIQTMGQSEMRVGLHSSDFGNISISTSATRDMVSAQITLDHGELAKTLLAHLPEMQARLGADRPLEVRIDMNGQAGGTSASLAHSSAGSNADRQQRSAALYQPANSVAQPTNFISAAVMPTGETGHSRLDVRA
ncbi:MAG: hypothetical protein WA510_18965 [Acidobacteriaceae bacterium]